eukprot:CAMPEP_0175047684 /NCGR_PEP_ID=MMETSP0052_2-20121109/5744_1 /TAXON_ID=51329 ORGANISM="Polytomella parva, Strain SAG 63-3" /NCGR_SAMPLE_ID=MMETSP0052_2 /ASSEMBLY_ACC=CAM_ASM_000194 /LENGTH=94 /DNA_ID=CAMNT_0016311611 /DNA_START=84 /DNA_END=364 /DNA_ORIENTATION=-
MSIGSDTSRRGGDRFLAEFEVQDDDRSARVVGRGGKSRKHATFDLVDANAPPKLKSSLVTSHDRPTSRESLDSAGGGGGGGGGGMNSARGGGGG